MKKASIRFPSKLKTKKCWVGSYGGHFSIVVIFTKKPVKAKKGSWNENEYDVVTNQKIIAGVFDKDSFNEWFGTNIEPDDIYITSVEEYEITAMWDEYDKIIGLNPNAD